MMQYETNDTDTIILKGYYTKEENVERPLEFGLWEKTSQTTVPNVLKPGGGTCCDMMHFMYNNAYQPGATAEGSKPFQGYAEASRANQPSNLGSMKEIWKRFEFYCRRHGIDYMTADINDAKEMFWAYYRDRYYDKFYNSCKIMERYVREKRNALTPEQREKEREYMPSFLCDDETWIDGCKDYLRYLVTVSVRGFRMEALLYTALIDLYGGYTLESTQEMEKDGIDFVYVRNDTPYLVSVKPDTYRYKTCPSPLYKRRVVYYNKQTKDSNDLIFTFDTGTNILTDTKHPYDVD